MKKLYPPIKPYRKGYLSVSKLHTIYFEESGNPKGKPVIFLHGGPGGGISSVYRQFFHPKKWRMIIFDQRGCGKSTPYSELRENTTWNLVEDIEKLRRYLKIERWVVCGGSWGSTLSLAYSETYPERSKALILRGIFLLRQSELQWFYQKGADALFPDAWQDYLKPIPSRERHDMIRAYYKRLTSPNKKIRIQAAKAWTVWEARTSKLIEDPKYVRKLGRGKFADAFARIECHYFINKGFLKKEGQLLKNAYRIQKIPGVIVQGRYDVVCPMYSAWELHRAWPKAKFIVVGDAGHSMTEPGIQNALLAAIDRFSKL